MGTRPAIFKWRQTEPGLILCAVRWYLRYSLSLRDVEELLEERGLHVDHTTVWRWVQCYGLSWNSDCDGILSRQTSLGGWLPSQSSDRGLLSVYSSQHETVRTATTEDGQ